MEIAKKCVLQYNHTALKSIHCIAAAHGRTFSANSKYLSRPPSTRKVNHCGFYWSKRRWGGCGISWTICKSFAPCSRQITTPVPELVLIC